MGDSDFFWVQSGDLIISGSLHGREQLRSPGEAEDRCVVSIEHLQKTGLIKGGQFG
jgi:hypothetical protein